MPQQPTCANQNQCQSQCTQDQNNATEGQPITVNKAFPNRATAQAIASQIICLQCFLVFSIKNLSPSSYPMTFALVPPNSNRCLLKETLENVNAPQYIFQEQQRLKFRNVSYLTLFLFFLFCFSYIGLFEFPYKFQHQIVNFCRKVSQDCVEYVDRSEVYCRVPNINSSDP